MVDDVIMAFAFGLILALLIAGGFALLVHVRLRQVTPTVSCPACGVKLRIGIEDATPPPLRAPTSD